ncbi:MAG: hypothetical protein GY754_16660 [bacterium]|nr:hypothetical protein [bacterium]
MKKIILMLVLSAFFISPELMANEKLTCKKYVGHFNEWKISVFYNEKGKMEIGVEMGNSVGSFSTLGTYYIKEDRIDFYHRGRLRTVDYNKKGSKGLKGSPYSFDLGKERKRTIKLKEDKSFAKECGK